MTVMGVVVTVIFVLIIVKTGSLGKAIGFLFKYFMLPIVFMILGVLIGTMVAGDTGKVIGAIIGLLIGFILALKSGIKSARGGQYNNPPQGGNNSLYDRYQ